MPDNDATPVMDRRQALRLLSTLGGAALGGLVLPSRWDAPRLEFGTLPAHAQSSAKVCTSSPSACAVGAMAVPFDTSSPAQASFVCSLVGLTAGSNFLVQLDTVHEVVTVSAKGSGYSVDSATLGSVSGGVLTYPWSTSAPVNTLNLSIPYTDPCSLLTNPWRVTVDIEIATGPAGYVLNVRNLSTFYCAFN